MKKQLNIFEQQKEETYKAYYNSFYKGVKERYQKQKKNNTHVYICIDIKNKVTPEGFLKQLDIRI